MPKSFYFYLRENLFLHEKSCISWCIRISLNWRNELNKDMTVVYPYFEFECHHLGFQWRTKSGNKGRKEWISPLISHCSHFHFSLFLFFISFLFCYVSVLFFVFRADTSLFLFNLSFEHFILHIFLIIIIIIRCSGMFRVPVLSTPQLTAQLWRTCLQRIFQVFLQLMVITLYMLAEIARSSFTGRGDPSELCGWTSLPCCYLKPFSRVITPLESE